MFPVFQCSNDSVAVFSVLWCSCISVFPVILTLTPHRSLSLQSCVTGLGFASVKSHNHSPLLRALTFQQAGQTLCKGAQVVLQLWNLGSSVWKRNNLIIFFLGFIMLSHPELGYFLQKAHLQCWSRCLTDIKNWQTFGSSPHITVWRVLVHWHQWVIVLLILITVWPPDGKTAAKRKD